MIGILVVKCPTFSFLRSIFFFLQGLGFGLLYWAVSRQRNDCCTGQSPGNACSTRENVESVWKATIIDELESVHELGERR